MIKRKHYATKMNHNCNQKAGENWRKLKQIEEAALFLTLNVLIKKHVSQSVYRPTYPICISKAIFPKIHLTKLRRP